MHRTVISALALPALALGSFASSADAAQMFDGGDLTVVRTFDLSGTAQSGSRVVTPNSAYSNVTTFSGDGVTNGGFAAGTPAAATAGNMIFDDLNTVSPGRLDIVRFSLVNFNTSTQPILSGIRIYSDNGLGTGPGTFLGGFNFNAFSAGGLSVTILSFNPSFAQEFNLPGGKLWAGVGFRADGTLTSAVLNNFGQGVFDPVDLGTSDDQMFTAAPTATPFTASNLPGTLAIEPFAVDGFVANFGWELVIPEPTSLTMVGAGILTLASRRRRA